MRGSLTKLAAHGAIACVSNSLFLQLDADRAPELKPSVDASCEGRKNK